MQRVMIVGGPGSGKTTLANAMAERVNLPLWHIDQILWAADWVERDETDRIRDLYEIQTLDRWIIDGCYAPTMTERVARADTLIFLDFPVWQRIARVTWRVLQHRGEPRPEMPEGCVERFDHNFTEFLDFIWRTRDSLREKMVPLIEEPPAHLAVHHLRSGREVRRFLADLVPPNQPAIGAVSSA
ncbi:MAG: AAA family ATPase [Pseudomonadota bacterium]